MTTKFAISDQSRFVATPLFQQPPDSKFWGTWVPLYFNIASNDTVYSMSDPDEGMRIDNISWKNYRDVSLWWVICQANNISNPFVELRSQETFAQTPNVIGQFNTLIFKAYAKFTGYQYNTGNVDGLEIVTTKNSIAIYKNYVQVEFFDNLSPYPTLGGSTTSNPAFWGNINSQYISIDWLSPYTVRPADGGLRDAPLPGNKRYSFYGGKENAIRALRIPAQQNVNKVLSSSQ